MFRTLAWLRLALGIAFLAAAGPAHAALLVVEDGGSFASIQAALDAAQPGDTIQVREAGGPWREKLVFPRSGTATGGFISLEAYPGERPVLDGTDVAGANMILIEDRSYIRVAGFELRNNLGVNDGSAVRIIGADEVSCGDLIVNPGEECDDGNTVDGDGCDSNCTFSGCGNGILTGAEQCDDGNLDDTDCCRANCLLAADGASCDDGRGCTQIDHCTADTCSPIPSATAPTDLPRFFWWRPAA